MNTFYSSMRIAIVAPSPVPYNIGGAENLWWGLLDSLNQLPNIQAELIKIPSPENNLEQILNSYYKFATLNLDYFDIVISTKYPAWAINHSCHILYLQHTLRGLYDTYSDDLPNHINDKELQQLKNWGLKPNLGDALMQILIPGCTIQSLGLDPNELPKIIRSFQLCLDKNPNSIIWRLPGPVSKAIIRLIDRLAMDESRIIKYAAISHTVAKRSEYFPAGIAPSVYYHPSILNNLTSSSQDYVFSASRLVSDKRIDLIIKAYKNSGVKVPLKIAGTGPMEGFLKDLAKDTPNIIFLGRLNNLQLSRAYEGAICVIFAPCNEDYGLITVEAFGASKPVITTSDAGGPTEWVIPGETGWVTEPNQNSLANAIREACNQPQECSRLGSLAKARVQNLNWVELVNNLLSKNIGYNSILKKYKILENSRVPDIIVLNSYAITPVVSGGQLRLINLYGSLAKKFKVHAITVGPFNCRQTIKDGFTEQVILKSEELIEYEIKLSKELGISAGDLAISFKPQLIPKYYEALKKSCVGVPTIICAHPYMYPMVARLQAEGIWKGRLIYEAHNFEFGLKSSICETTWVVNAIKRIELACYQASDLVTTCSVDDLKLMQEFYGNKNYLIIPNGVDINSIQFISPEKRRDNKLKLGISSKYFLALFMGSDHMPNQEALKNIFKAAPFCKDVIFLIIGSVCNPFFKENIPENVRLIGMVDEFTKNQFLGCTDIGLNPLKSGSGTNLKMAEYAASGIWIISTQVGGRGFWITNEHYSPIREKYLASDLNKLIESTKTDHIDKLIYQAYIHIRTFGNWDDAITPLVDILKIT